MRVCQCRKLLRTQTLTPPSTVDEKLSHLTDEKTESATFNNLRSNSQQVAVLGLESERPGVKVGRSSLRLLCFFLFCLAISSPVLVWALTPKSMLLRCSSWEESDMNGNQRLVEGLSW